MATMFINFYATFAATISETIPVKQGSAMAKLKPDELERALKLRLEGQLRKEFGPVLMSLPQISIVKCFVSPDQQDGRVYITYEANVFQHISGDRRPEL